MSFWDSWFVREGSHSCMQDLSDAVFVYFLAASIPSTAADIHFSAVLIFSERSLWFRVATSLK